MDQRSRAEDPEVVGVCVIRVWAEPGTGGLRARVSAVADLAAGSEEVVVTTDRAGVLAAVERFLDAHCSGARRGRRGDGSVTDGP